jgi:hypothetical protein
MAERRKIVIQTGADEPLPTPHFDAEATLTARPVVPLTDQETHQMQYGNYAGRAAAKPFWKRPALLALIVLVAVGIGVAAGLAIGIYRNRNAAEAPVATTPSSPSQPVEDAKIDPTVEQPQPAPTEQARAAVPDESDETDEPQETPAASKVEERERTIRNERKNDDDDEARPTVVAKPPVVREKKPVKIDEYVIEDGREARRAEKEQRREERRDERRGRRRRGREDEVNIPRGIDRAGREVDRIREIFEGRQP